MEMDTTYMVVMAWIAVAVALTLWYLWRER